LNLRSRSSSGIGRRGAEEYDVLGRIVKLVSQAKNLSLAGLLVALECVEPLAAALVVHVLQAVHPAKVCRTPGSVCGSCGSGAQLQQRLVFLPDGREAAFLEGDEVLPAVLLADRQDRPVGIQAVQAQAQQQLGNCFLRRGASRAKALSSQSCLVALGRCSR